jgi:hypothetical protein
MGFTRAISIEPGASDPARRREWALSQTQVDNEGLPRGRAAFAWGIPMNDGNIRVQKGAHGGHCGEIAESSPPCAAQVRALTAASFLPPVRAQTPRPAFAEILAPAYV